MTETRFYEPARLSTPAKPLLLLTPLDAQPGWGHCYLRSSVWETGSSQCCLELHHGTVWGWIFRTTFQQLSAYDRELKWRRRRRQRKRRCQNEFASHQTLSCLRGPAQFAKLRRFSWSWILKDFIQVLEKKRKFVVVCSPPALNVALWGFT